MTYHFGYWVFGGDIKKVNLENLKKNGTTDLFLNYYAFTVHGESTVAAWIEKAKGLGINVHIWMQCFYDGSWINPKTANLSSKVAEAMKYAHMKNVAGVHLDYLRYPGNAYKTSGGADAITAFVKQVKSAIPEDIVLSCAVMPENETKYYYGQDIDALGKIVDVIIPMQYKGNYSAGSSWLTSTTKLFASKATIWSGLQSYKSDENPTKLPGLELLDDVKTCLNAGAKGAIMFRFGLVGNLNYKSLLPKENTVKEVAKSNEKTISNSNVFALARSVKASVEKNKKLESSFKVGDVTYTASEAAYILSAAINNLNSNVTIPTGIKAPSSFTGGELINEDIYPSDFKNQAERIVNYVKKNGQIPLYVTSVKSQKQISVQMFTYAFSKTLVWYKDHSTTLPNYTTYDTRAFSTSTTNSTNTSSTTSNNCTNPYVSSPHYTTTGCNKLGQCTPYYCGPHSIHQALKKFGITDITEAQLASVAGTTSAGTDHEGLSTAVAWVAKKKGIKLDVEWKRFSELGATRNERFENAGKLACKPNKALLFHIGYEDSGSSKGDTVFGHYEMCDKFNIKTEYVRALNSLGSRSGNGYLGHLQDRSFSLQEHFINNISQKSVMIITKG